MHAQYEHDCNTCIFVGVLDQEEISYDLYFHPAVEGRTWNTSYLARMSDDAPEYLSFENPMQIVRYNPEYVLLQAVRAHVKTLGCLVCEENCEKVFQSYIDYYDIEGVGMPERLDRETKAENAWKRFVQHRDSHTLSLTEVEAETA